MTAQQPNQFSLTFDQAFADFMAKKIALYPDLMKDPKAPSVMREIFEAGFVAGLSAAALNDFRRKADPFRK